MLTTSGDAQNDQVGKLEQLSSVLSSGRPFINWRQRKALPAEKPLSPDLLPWQNVMLCPSDLAFGAGFWVGLSAVSSVQTPPSLSPAPWTRPAAWAVSPEPARVTLRELARPTCLLPPFPPCLMWVLPNQCGDRLALRAPAISVRGRSVLVL